MSKLFESDGHISIEAVYKLKEGSLNDDDMMLVLEHIANCSECAEILADSYNENELAEVPEGFEEGVKLKAKSKIRKKFEFGLYCIKVTAAAAIAIAVVFSGQLSIVINSVESKTDIVCTHLNIISERINNLEVFK